MENIYATENASLVNCDSFDKCSFYDLVDKLIPYKFNAAPLHRFLSIMRKMKSKSYLLEELEIDGEIKEEKEMFENIRGAIEFKAQRISFFSSADCKEIDEITEDNFLGYAVIITAKKLGNYISAYILESIVKPPELRNYYLHNIRVHKTCIGTKENSREFRIKGSFFAQQSRVTHACAHAAIRVAINSHPIFGQRKLTNKYINSLTNNPERGLYKPEIMNVIKSLGFKIFQADFSENTKIDYDHFLYPYLESCLPTILGINRWDRINNQMVGHVVTVLGHTTNFDRWQPEADRGYGNYPIKPYISTAEWCDHYIINDDNYGMYCTLPSESMRNFIVPDKNPNPHAVIALIIAPRELELEGYYAEQKSIVALSKILSHFPHCLGTNNNWVCRIIKAQGSIVCRTILVNKEDYMSQFAEIGIALELPEKLWVTEISLPNLYCANKRKIGDIVWNAQKKGPEQENPLFAWFPEIFLENQFLNYGFKVNTHLPIFRGTGAVLEW
ncbi:MAG: hypothetical protein ACYSSI_02005 [Planctomycetota bacterium]|jgi:hypothetical protein